MWITCAGRRPPWPTGPVATVKRMSSSLYTSQVNRLQKERASLLEKAAKEREKAAKEAQAATRRLKGIARHTSESQRLSKQQDAARLQERAARHEAKAADYDRQAASKGDALQRSQQSLQRAEASEARRDQSRLKREREKELQELQVIERRRREAQILPDFQPQRILPGPVSVGSVIRSTKTAVRSRFDVCLSFAGEQRSYVELVARSLKGRGYSVFYDADQQADLWGKNLTEHFDYIYREACRACVMFISAEYAQKPWARHERRSALARALEEDEYVLPARFDDTELPGLPPTVGYVDLAEFAPDSLTALIAEKLGEPQPE